MLRTSKYIIFFLILSAGFALGQGRVDQIRKEFLDPQSKVVLVAAHRAAHTEYPENSLPAIRHSIELGVDIVELDVRVTKDGVPVLMHDGKIDRTTTGKGKPSDYTLDELQQFHLVHEGVTTEYRIPTFEEALKLVKGNIMVDIDLKTDKLDPIIEVIRKTGCEDHVFFFDNDYNALQYVRDADPDFMLMPRAYSYEMADSALTRFHPQVIHIDFKFYNQKVVDLIKSNNARVWINALGLIDVGLGTENEEKAMEKLLKYGANIVQTDKPELLLKALKKRNLHP